MTDQVKNYTDEMTAELIASYKHKDGSNQDFVAEAAKTLGKTTRSIVAKLSKEGAYVVEGRKTKTGEKVVTKAELVSAINVKLGVEGLGSLAKATKQDLQDLVNAL
jgi:TolB-like protein